MNLSEQWQRTPYLVVTLAVIFAFAVWGTSFSHTCQSDGCIGVVFPIGVAFVALALQVCVLIPVLGVRRWRAKEPAAKLVTGWLVASVLAFVLPLLAMK